MNDREYEELAAEYEGDLCSVCGRDFGEDVDFGAESDDGPLCEGCAEDLELEEDDPELFDQLDDEDDELDEDEEDEGDYPD